MQNNSSFQKVRTKAKVYTYESSDDDVGAYFKQSKSSKRSKSVSSGLTANRNLGSDTCSFETAEDYQINLLCSPTKPKFPTGKASPLGFRSPEKAQLPPKITYPMDNMGNTCFFNSVMQCLTHTIPLHQLCLNKTHEKQCTRQSQGCYQRRYAAFIQELAARKRTNPAPILKSLPAIWRGYRIGQ